MTTQLRDPIDDHELDRRLRATFAAVMPMLDAAGTRGDVDDSPTTSAEPHVVELDRSAAAGARRGRAIVASLLVAAATVVAVIVVSQREVEAPVLDVATTLPATPTTPEWYDVIRPYLPDGFDQIALMRAGDDVVSFRAWRTSTGQILEVTIGLRTGDLKETNETPTDTDEYGEWFESPSGVALETADGRMISLACGVVVVGGGAVGSVGMTRSTRDYCDDEFDDDRVSRREMVQAFATTFPTDVTGPSFGSPAPHTTDLSEVESVVEAVLPDVDVSFGSTQWDGVVQFADASPADAPGTTELSIVYGVYPPRAADANPAFAPAPVADPSSRMTVYDDVAFGWMVNDSGTGFHVVTNDLATDHLLALGTMLEQLAALTASDEPIPDTLPPSSPTSTVAPTTTSSVTVDGPRLLVANASTVNGAAGLLTGAVADDYAALAATNAIVKVERSVVYFATGFDEAAAQFAELLGGADVAPVPESLPIEGGGDGVSGHAASAFDLLVLLGNDHANEWPGDMPTTTIG